MSWVVVCPHGVVYGALLGLAPGFLLPERMP
jgi:hypothetical protein